MPPTTSKNDSQPIVPYNVHTQAGFDTPFIKRRGFIPLGISEMSLTFFKHLQAFKVVRKVNIWLHTHY